MPQNMNKTYVSLLPFPIKSNRFEKFSNQTGEKSTNKDLIFYFLGVGPSKNIDRGPGAEGEGSVGDGERSVED